MREIETERIVNLEQYENVIRETRLYVIALKRALQEKDMQTSIHIAEKIDFKLHEMEAFDFVLERRKISIQ